MTHSYGGQMQPTIDYKQHFSPSFEASRPLLPHVLQQSMSVLHLHVGFTFEKWALRDDCVIVGCILRESCASFIQLGLC
jgi:hypothetical protein